MSSDLFSSEDTIAQMVRAISGLMRCLPAVVVVLVRFQVFKLNYNLAAADRFYVILLKSCYL